MNFTARAKTNITVLEIATSDFKRLLHNDYKQYLENISLHKHLLMLGRFEDIVNTARE